MFDPATLVGHWELEPTQQQPSIAINRETDRQTQRERERERERKREREGERERERERCCDMQNDTATTCSLGVDTSRQENGMFALVSLFVKD